MEEEEEEEGEEEEEDEEEEEEEESEEEIVDSPLWHTVFALKNNASPIQKSKTNIRIGKDKDENVTTYLSWQWFPWG